MFYDIHILNEIYSNRFPQCSNMHTAATIHVYMSIAKLQLCYEGIYNVYEEVMCDTHTHVHNL